MENVLEQSEATEDPTEAVEEHVEADPDEDRERIERRARDLGWAPQENWKGDPEYWKDASEFLEYGEQVLHASRNNVQKLEQRLEEERRAREQDTETWQQRFERLERMNSIAMDRQREQLINQFEARKREAASLGDMDEYERASTEQREQLKALDEQAKEAAPKEPEPSQNGIDAQTQRALDNWKADNRWYNTDPVRQALAHGLFDQVEKDMPNADFEKKLEEVTNRVMDAMPLDSGTSRRSANVVEGGSRVTSPNKSGKLASKLPPEAKEAGNRFVKDGYFKDIEEYAKEYFENE